MTPRRGKMQPISGRINPSLRGRTSKTSMALATVGVLNARKRSSTAGSNGFIVISPSSRTVSSGGTHYSGVTRKTISILPNHSVAWYHPWRYEVNSCLDFTAWNPIPPLTWESEEQMRGKKCYGRKLIYAIMVLLFGVSTTIAQNKTDPLKNGFENPPNGARPRVWWHWMNGNITKEGIKLDLEWMHRVGLGGFQNFDAALDTPQVVEHRLAYMTPEGKDAFKYATILADKLGLEEAIAGST